MGRRLDLQAILEAIPGVSKVYFQPPEDVKLSYPAIVYSRDYVASTFAGNRPYRHTKRYLITVIDRNPDSKIPDYVSSLPMSSFDRAYSANQLNHDVYSVYF